MPFYEFECPKGHVTEKLMTIAEGDGISLVECVECSKTRVGRAELSHMARRILAPPPTTFVAAGGRKL